MTIDAINKLMFAEKVRKGLTTDRSFYLEEGRSGISNLSAGITLNNITVYPTFRYRVQDQNIATWPAWGYGETLTLTGTGSDPTIVDSPFHDGSKAVRFNSAVASKGYISTSTGLAGITTEDFLVEAVIQLSNPVYEAGILGVISDGSHYWYLGDATAVSGNLYFRAAGSTGSFNYYSINGEPGQWHHFIGAYKSGVAVYTYLDGVASQTGSIDIGTCNPNTQFYLGCYPDWNVSTATIALASFYKANSWVTATALATLAKSRYHSLLGLGPQQVNKSSSYTLSSASAHYLDKLDSSGNTKLYYMGAGNIREVEREDSSGDSWKGLLCEYQSTNLFPYSTSLNYVSLDHVSFPSESFSCPDTTRTNAIIKEDSSNSEHGVTNGVDQALTATVFYTMSFYAKAINRNWINAWIYDATNTVELGHINYNLTTIALGTVGSGVTGSIESIGDGWNLCKYQWTQATNSAQFYPYIYTASANGTITYQGLNQNSLAITHVQIEALDYPSSPIVTSGSSVTRASEYLYYPSLGNIGSYEGWIKARVLFPSYTHGSTGSTVWTLSDNGASTDRICLFIGGSGYVNAFSSKTDTTGDASVTIEQNVCDGQVWDIVCTWCNGHFVLGAQAIHSTERYWDEDTSADIPYVHGPNGRLHIACDQANTGQLGPGILIDLEVLPKYNRSFRRK